MGAKTKKRPEPVTKFLRVDPELKRRIVVRVGEIEGNMNDLLVGILAERFGVRFEGSGRSAEVGDSPGVVLRMPPALARKIELEAARRGVPRRDVMLEAISAEFGIEHKPGGRWPKA